MSHFRSGTWFWVSPCQAACRPMVTRARGGPPLQQRAPCLQRLKRARVTSSDPYFASHRYRGFTWPNCRLVTRNGCSTLALTEVLARCTTA